VWERDLFWTLINWPLSRYSSGEQKRVWHTNIQETEIKSGFLTVWCQIEVPRNSEMQLESIVFDFQADKR